MSKKIIPVISEQILKNGGSCCHGRNWFRERFGKSEVKVDTIIDTLIEREIEVDDNEFLFPFTECDVKITRKAIQYFIDNHNPTSSELTQLLVTSLPEAPTAKIIEVFIETDPDNEEMFKVLFACKKARTTHLIKEFMKFGDINNMSEFLEEAPEFHKVWIIKQFIKESSHNTALQKQVKEKLPEKFHKYFK